MSIQREEGLSISMIFRRAYQRGKFYQTLTDERQNARHHTPSDYFPAVSNIVLSMYFMETLQYLEWKLT